MVERAQECKIVKGAWGLEMTGFARGVRAV